MWTECVKCRNEFSSDNFMDMVCPSCLARSSSQNRQAYQEWRDENPEPNYPTHYEELEHAWDGNVPSSINIGGSYNYSVPAGKSVSENPVPKEEQILPETPEQKEIRELKNTVKIAWEAMESWEKKYIEILRTSPKKPTENKSIQTEEQSEETQELIEVPPKK